MAIWVIVPAAGTGTRMSSSIPKQYMDLDGTSVLRRSLSTLSLVPNISAIVLAIDPADEYAAQDGLVDGASINACPLVVCHGGDTRAQSVMNALHALETKAKPDDWVVVHDAARPCVRVAEIKTLLESIEGTQGGLLAAPVRGTLKKADGNNSVAATVDREGVWEAATPQVFPYGALSKALGEAIQNHLTVTDEASAMEAQGAAPLLVSCSTDNLKITYPQDLHLAKLILQSQQIEQEQRETYVE
ncbi:MAG: 2-C-methyl-D-erythritol 4-phosphate cytidylyltransferase [Pseudohongiellaceae bacterium]|nr:2-C-methyl-D-erythritol 4-phosphate cytidylyltransferase [Pseudohongiellaceae bacterium]